MNNSDFNIIHTQNGTEACYHARIELQANNTASKVLPDFVFRLIIFLVFNRLFLIVLRPLRQPQVVAQILTGILLGPTVLGHVLVFVSKLFPYRNTKLPEIFGNLALVYYALLAGLEMDRNIFMRNGGRNVFTLTISGVLFPFMLGLGLFVLFYDSPDGNNLMTGSVIWATALASTSFSDVASVLADLNLLDTDIGRLALSSSAFGELCTWLLLAGALSIVNAASFYALLSTFAFALISVFLVRPAIYSYIKRATEHNAFSDMHIWFILGWTMLFGLITDACGTHAVVGSFMLGIIMPHEASRRVSEKVHDFVSLMLMPFFFLTIGLQFDIGIVFRETPWHSVILFLCLCFLAKIMAALIAHFLTRIPLREAMTLGLILNTKGSFALLIVNAGRSAKALNNQTFPIMVLAFLLMTCLAEPLASVICKLRKRVIKYKHRSVESVRGPSTQFRILACVRSIHDASSVISLLEASKATLEFPIVLIGVHLVELLGRSTSMLVVHDRARNNYMSAKPQAKSESDQIMDAFRSYEKRNHAVIVHRITALSPHEKINSDLCNLAEEKEVALIIMPFQGSLRPLSPSSRKDAFQGINQYVLANAPCSVGIFVDRGLNSIEQVKLDDTTGKGIHIAMIFIGGPDDRDALAYAWKMAGHPRVSLTMLRLLLGKDFSSNQNIGYAIPEYEKRLDDDFIYEFIFKTKDDVSINYQEKVVGHGDDTFSIIKEKMVADNYNLFVIGRGEILRLRLLGISDSSTNCPELGALGDALTSSSFASHTSLLVVQHHIAMTGSFITRTVEKTSESPNDSTTPSHPLMANSLEYNDSRENHVRDH